MLLLIRSVDKRNFKNHRLLPILVIICSQANGTEYSVKKGAFNAG